MRLKSYFVPSVEDALVRAKVELGEDALLVNTRRMDAPEGGRPRMEVVFAVTEDAPPPPVVATPPAGKWDQFRGELGNLLHALENKPDAARLTRVSPACQAVDLLRGRLVQAEVPHSLIDPLADGARPMLEARALRGGEMNADDWAGLLPPIATRADEATLGRRRIAFIGAAGAGKTSAAAKLAFRLGVAGRRNTLLVSLDNVRIGATDQLARLAKLLGVPFEAPDSAHSFSTLLKANVHRDLILIDTPGLTSGDPETARELAQSLRSADPVERHLIIPAVLRYFDMQRRLEDAQGLCPTHLLFSRLDETTVHGPMWALAHTSGLPLSWSSTGPSIPADLEPASSAGLAGVVLSAPRHPTLTPPPRSHAAGAGQ